MMAGIVKSRRVFVLLVLAGAVLGVMGMAEGKEKIKIILDTDIAGDIDDAFAQALVQVSEEFEVLGITIAYGPTDRRAKVSCRMLYNCGQEQIPVAAGRPTNQSDAPQLHWADGFELLKPVKESAADFIIRNLRKYPGEVTIISVGPVTNLGDVIDKDPEAWKMVKGVYSMFGSFYMGYGIDSKPTNEYNVRADVAASKKFMTSGVPITLAGLDVTTMVKFKEDRRLQIQLRNSPLTDALCGLYSLWSIDHYGQHPTLYDPVAVTMVMTDEFVTTKPVHVVVTDDGHTIIDENKKPNCRIGTKIETEKFLKWLTDRLLKQNLGR